MWAVTEKFKEALAFPHGIVTTVTCTPPGGGDPLELELLDGTLELDASARIRRRAPLTIAGSTAIKRAVARPGARFAIQTGLKYWSSTELIPVLTGVLAGNLRRQYGDGSIDLILADDAQPLSERKLITPYAPAIGTTRIAAITAVLEQVMPGIAIENRSTDHGTITVDQVWDGGALDVVASLTTDGGTVGYFDPLGVFVIEDLPDVSSPAVCTIAPGERGTLKSLVAEQPMVRLYNTVVVRPSSPEQGWTQQVAQITDTAHERHPDYIGVVPKIIVSPSADSAEAAMLIATTQLNMVLGTADTLRLDAIANPALEGNDVVRVISPALNQDPAETFQHFVDSFTLNLRSGSMSAGTRRQVVTDE